MPLHFSTTHLIHLQHARPRLESPSLPCRALRLSVLNASLLEVHPPGNGSPLAIGLYGFNLSATSLRVTSADQGSCLSFEWTRPSVSSHSIEASPSLSGSFPWLAGQELFTSHLLSYDSHGDSYPMQPFLSSDIYAEHCKLGGVLEGRWMSGKGWTLEVETGDDSPIWVSFRENASSLCLRSEYSNVFGESQGRPAYLNFSLCKYTSLKEAWIKQVHNKFEYVSSTPPPSMVLFPVWSTWAAFKKGVNQTAVLQLATTIQRYKLEYSAIEIDDGWSTTYGDFKFDPKKFSNPTSMVFVLEY